MLLPHRPLPGVAVWILQLQFSVPLPRHLADDVTAARLDLSGHAVQLAAIEGHKKVSLYTAFYVTYRIYSHIGFSQEYMLVNYRPMFFCVLRYHTKHNLTATVFSEN
uniref:Putative secreted protein n=1 Tax=Ixodes ricinus TaxID=34613 RepID=A0A6B0UGR1_IXORI